MLQQTQVQTVLSRFYEPFMQAFPSLQALAAASRDEVLKRWEGLGYYSRAANLHKAAQQAAPDMPHDVEGLLALPGIGQNTAHAIAAFAYRQPVAVMEANVKRVLCRIFALKAAKPDALWDYAVQLLDKAEPYDYNQAMMDIGAMVCTRRTPSCNICPAKGICKGKQSPEAYPAARAKKTTPIRKAHIIVWRNAKGELHLTPRETAFLGGLYGFAEYPATAECVSFDNRLYRLDDAEDLGAVSQTYSHFRMDAHVWLVQVGEQQGAGWCGQGDVDKLALSGLDHKVLQLVRSRYC